MNGGAVRAVFVEPLAVISAFECAALQGFFVGFRSRIRHDRIKLGGIRIQLFGVIQRHLERFWRVAGVSDHKAAVHQKSGFAGILHKLNGLVGVLDALVNILQNFGTCAFKAHAHFASACFVHQFQKFQRHVGSGVAAPSDF